MFFGEPGRTLYPSFIGEVALQALGVDDGVRGLDAHETPGAAAQISEMLVLSGYGRYGARRVVACHGDDGDGIKPRELLQRWGEGTEDRAWFHHLAKLIPG